MTDREKLIELIGESLCNHLSLSCKLAENIAADLIANGVTFATDKNVGHWIQVTERLPEEDGWYQVWTRTPFGGFKSFNKASFHNGEWHGSGWRWTNVTHWMPLPDAPKEV